MQTVPALTEAHLQHMFAHTFALQSLLNNALLTLLSMQFCFFLNITINIMLWSRYQGVFAPQHFHIVTSRPTSTRCAQRELFLSFPPPHCRNGTFLQAFPFPLVSLSSRRPVSRAQRVGEWKRSPLTITPFAHRIFSCTFLLFLSFSILPSVEDVLYHEGKVRCNCLCARVCALRQGCGFWGGG